MSEDHRSPPTPDFVTVEECSEFRRRVRAGEFAEWVANDVGRHGDTVRLHAYGRCCHPDDVPPADPTGRRGNWCG